MKKAMVVIVIAAMCGLLLGFVGCKKEGGGGSGSTATGTSSTKVDMTTPIDQVKSMVADMDVDALRKKAMAYKDEIMAQNKTLETLMAQLKEIPIAEQMGEEAKGLQSDIKKATDALTALKDRFQVYYDAIKEKGGDLTGLELSL